MQNSTLLRLTNGESSTSSRDEIDFNFDLTMDDEMHIEEEHQMLLRRSARNSHTPFDERSSVGNGSDAPDFMAEEATESFDEHDSTTDNDDDNDDDYNEGDDDFDVMVTRGRAKRTSVAGKKQKPAKKEKATTKNSSTTVRQNRTTRAASVRF